MNTRSNQLSGKKVLVVDDEVDLREIICEDFELMGATVFNAGNGKVAFDMAQEILPDAIVSDIRMAGGDGIELLKRVRSSSLTPAPKVVLITGFADLTVEEATSMGAQGMLPKPFNLRQLRQMVIDLLAESNDEL